MPLVDVAEPHARPPRIPAVRPGAVWDGTLDLDRGWAELVGVEAAGTELDLSGCEELEIADSLVTGLAFRGGAGTTIELRNTVLTDCDLSQVRLGAGHGVRLVGCKLAGTDLSAAGLTDVEFERCTLLATNLRMARLARVAFDGCVLEQVDAFDVSAEDVSFDGSRLVEVSVDRLSADRVDLRGASELGLTAIGRLDGCLLAVHQLPALAPALALALGIDLERPEPS